MVYRTRIVGVGVALVLCASGAAWGEEVAEVTQNTAVVMQTSEGAIEIVLWDDKAPITVKNFLNYVDKGHYEGTTFHRVIKGFMVQGGGYTVGGAMKPADAPIKNEADNGLKNRTGTIAMARTSVVDSATAQFFINTVDNTRLDHAGPGAQFGYAVFGEVVSGMDVVQKIESTPTGARDQPTKQIVIESVKRK
jgi:cyclophilin family peptidyl-prolyl cis-trans isomerase